MDLREKVVVITGASSGIGKELAHQLARKGSRLVLAARRAPLLNEVARDLEASGASVLAVPTDVSHRPEVEHLMKSAHDRFGRLDVLINNAGVSTADGVLMGNQEADVRATWEINFMGPLYGVWAAVPFMEKTGGQIVFVSSILGKRGVPRNAIYSASKFALQGLTESIRPELARQGIRVITICPAGVATPFFEVNGKGNLRRYRLHPVDKIARMIVRACEKEKREVLLTMDAKLLYWLNVFFPRLVDWGVAKNKGV